MSPSRAALALIVAATAVAAQDASRLLATVPQTEAPAENGSDFPLTSTPEIPGGFETPEPTSSFTLTSTPLISEPAITEPASNATETTAPEPPTAEPPLDPMCVAVMDKDRVGFDLKNVPGKQFFECQKPCFTTPGCVTFSWSDFNGGTCWLKSAFGPQVEMPGVSTALCTSHACVELKNQDRPGSDLANAKGGFEDCAGHCRNTKGCVTFSWSDHEGGTCWLKSTEAPIVVKQGVSTTGCIYGSPVPPPAPVCSVYKDIDFVGNDIANKPGKSADDCCGICDKHAGCTAYAWSDHNGGTCWLKKSVGHVIAKAGVTSGSTVKLFGPVCPFEYDVDFVGNDVGNKPAKDAGVCCDLCKKTAGCKAYTWSNFNGGTCWMKSAKGKIIAAPGKISAKLTDF